MFNEAETLAEDDTLAVDTTPESETTPPKKKEKTKRKPLPEHLPQVQVFHDIGEADKRRYRVASYQRTTPLPACSAKSSPINISTPYRFIDKTPLFKQHGIEINRRTLPDWMMKCGTLFKPLYQRLRGILLSPPVIQADETTIKVTMMNERNRIFGCTAQVQTRQR
ncbi:IS66 family transposase [Shewanella algidipiscicola]|uniref:IS66 family transposase n=1 Tax=Shewanella algidipiscicola TaxID=614070 RepID=UPI0013A599CD|nr:transposase [Shewanella algidipiscicola]